ncbi:heterokaryon incompatibility protein-domain-containing protein [Xylariaceae sp. FL0804]|nr:heterokaryon incompatibility protein-domain-containing protein [Xylariaceae sp. FL0804]
MDVYEPPKTGKMYLKIVQSRASCRTWLLQPNIRAGSFEPRGLRLSGDPWCRPATWPDVGSPASAAWCREMLSICDEQHDVCSVSHVQSTERPFHPTRLIEVGFEADRVRLRHFPQGEPGPSKWACLSYVWGADQSGVLRTTRHSVSRHLAGLGLGDLPATVRDAVLVTRSIGLDWLWVDALCIVQDDDGDKVGELASMGDIYRRGYVTIAAACASSVRQGFLHDRGFFYTDSRSAPVAPPIRLRCRDGNDNSGRVWTTVLATDYPDRWTDDGWSPLETRGWCYQEKRLSPRLLYYGHRGLAFVCATLRRGDRAPLEFTHSLADELRPPSPSSARRRAAGAARRHGGWLTTPSGAADEWERIVEEYAGRELSRPDEDKLAALAGVAADFAARRADEEELGEYAAGLWVRHLPASLCWSADSFDVARNARPRGTGTRRYRAPSWSWATVDGRVYFRDGKRADFVAWGATVAAARATPASPRVPFGAVVEEDGVLELVTAAAEVVWSSDRPDVVVIVGTTTTDGDGVALAVRPDTLDPPPRIGPGDAPLVAAVLVVDQASTVYGLVLQRCDEQHYRRLGLFTSWKDVLRGPEELRPVDIDGFEHGVRLKIL